MSFAFDFDELGIRQRKKCSSKSLYIAEELFGGILKGLLPLRRLRGSQKGGRSTSPFCGLWFVSSVRNEQKLFRKELYKRRKPAGKIKACIKQPAILCKLRAYKFSPPLPPAPPFLQKKAFVMRQRPFFCLLSKYYDSRKILRAFSPRISFRSSCERPRLFIRCSSSSAFHIGKSVPYKTLSAPYSRINSRLLLFHKYMVELEVST